MSHCQICEQAQGIQFTGYVVYQDYYNAPNQQDDDKKEWYCGCLSASVCTADTTMRKTSGIMYSSQPMIKRSSCPTPSQLPRSVESRFTMRGVTAFPPEPGDILPPAIRTESHVLCAQHCDFMVDEGPVDNFLFLPFVGTEAAGENTAADCYCLKRSSCAPSHNIFYQAADVAHFFSRSTLPLDNECQNESLQRDTFVQLMDKEMAKGRSCLCIVFDQGCPLRSQWASHLSIVM